jgi:hypothetical protein
MKKNWMTRSAPAAPSVLTGLLLAALGFAVVPARPTVVVAVPGRAGAVSGTKQNSDEFLWRQLTVFAAPASAAKPKPVLFETWASDEDTFSLTPHWPGPDEPKKLHASLLGRTSTPTHGNLDVPCAAPAGAAVGGFPTTGTPAPCIAEEVKRNRPQYEYIVHNGLNTQVGLAAAYAKGFKVTMPTEALAVKGDWVPVATLLQWIPQLGSLANVEKLYYTTVSGGVEYGLVSLHVSSRQNPNWVWGTFEHQMNPGRCDDLGCLDTFGAVKPVVRPNRKAVNTQYGACVKTPRLKALMAKANLSPVWENYCLKSTMVDYTAPDGTPYALGNSVIERITGNGTVAASSCIGCHVYASFDAKGQVSAAALNILPYNPTGQPIPAVLDGSLQFDFMWGVLNTPAPKP